MNIFASSPCPTQSALNLDDRRLVKMVLESAQLLSTIRGGPYKPTHINHPSTLWAKEYPENTKWLYLHFLALAEEYRRRFNRTHKSFHTCIERFYLNFEPIKSSTPYSFMVVPGKYSLLPVQAAIAYQKILADKWTKSPGRFTNTAPPPFYPSSPPPILIGQSP